MAKPPELDRGQRLIRSETLDLIQAAMAGVKATKAMAEGNAYEARKQLEVMAGLVLVADRRAGTGDDRPNAYEALGI